MANRPGLAYAERAEHDQAIATTHAALNEEAFTAAWEEGKKMTLEQALALATEIESKDSPFPKDARGPNSDP